MKYPNASKGLKTIVAAEFAALAASIAAVIVSALAWSGADAAEPAACKDASAGHDVCVAELLERRVGEAASVPGVRAVEA